MYAIQYPSVLRRCRLTPGVLWSKAGKALELRGRLPVLECYLNIPCASTRILRCQKSPWFCPRRLRGRCREYAPLPSASPRELTRSMRGIPCHPDDKVRQRNLSLCLPLRAPTEFQQPCPTTSIQTPKILRIAHTPPNTNPAPPRLRAARHANAT